MRSIIAIAVIGVLILSSCKPKDFGSSMRFNYLTDGKWRIWKSEAITANPGGPDTLNLMNLMPQCIKDNYHTFGTTGQVTTYSATDKCDPNERASWSDGQWKFLSADTEIEMKDTLGKISVFKINMLNDTTLRLQLSSTNNNITTVTHHYYHDIK